MDHSHWLTKFPEGIANIMLLCRRADFMAIASWHWNGLATLLVSHPSPTLASGKQMFRSRKIQGNSLKLVGE